jgi:kynureninase
MPFTARDLAQTPNPLARHYSRFQVSERLLLTGHSHQAWPDVAFQGQQQAWLTAAEHVDDKWDAAQATSDRVRHGYARLLGEDDHQNIALGPATHDLLIKWLSALPLRERPRLVTTDGEFHAIRRQLDRLAEGWLHVEKVSADPPDAIAERLCAAVDDRTAAVLVSGVLFRSARIVPGLDRVMRACQRHGAELLVDAYHHLNVIPFSLKEMGIQEAFVTGGGYKYCQLGEGNAFLRVPPKRDLKPVVTGWYAEFDRLTASPGSRVAWGTGPSRFAGATYDPTSHYRAAAVFAFFQEQGLTPELLREVSQHQVGLLAEQFDALDLPPSMIARDRDVPLSDIGGFLTLTSPRADEISAALKTAGVYTDFRGDVLRLGPAPYLSDGQLVEAMESLAGARPA